MKFKITNYQPATVGMGALIEFSLDNSIILGVGYGTNLGTYAQFDDPDDDVPTDYYFNVRTGHLFAHTRICDIIVTGKGVQGRYNHFQKEFDKFTNFGEDLIISGYVPESWRKNIKKHRGLIERFLSKQYRC